MKTCWQVIGVFHYLQNAGWSDSLSLEVAQEVLDLYTDAERETAGRASTSNSQVSVALCINKD